MNKLSVVLIVLLLCGVTTCVVAADRPDHGQGEMAGHVTKNSVILQSRLTRGSTLIDGDLPGSPGIACFEISRNPEFKGSFKTDWIKAVPQHDYIVKTKVSGLKPATRYYYRLVYGSTRNDTVNGRTCTFKTLGGKTTVSRVRLAIVTGMNYFFFHEGAYDPATAYKGPDKALGYPGLASILRVHPDYFVGTGDNVYFDHPAKKANNPNRWTGLAWSDRAKTESEMRRKYHEQFVQPRFIDLFAKVPVYWEVDDHDYRYNDCDNTGDTPPLPALGAKNFKEQLPVVDPADPAALTYSTLRMNRDLQVWFLEGRMYRSPNAMPDGPDKSIWGKTQLAWLKKTLLESDATFKLIISPTPLVGPDGNGKRDNHANLKGFRHEADAFFAWLTENGFLEKHLYFACGDRHWQYHAIHPSGFEEFSCGALVQANSRLGVKAGSPKSTDPEGKIKQPYCQLEGEPSAGFLTVTVMPFEGGAVARFDFFDEFGKQTYTNEKVVQF